MTLLTVHHRPHLRAAERLGEQRPDRGSCELLTRGRRVRLFDPRIETDRSKGWAPLPVRLGLSLVRAPWYMRLSLVVRRLRIDAVAPSARAENGSLGDVLGNTSRSRRSTAHT
jgi:hypothetical protein